MPMTKKDAAQMNILELNLMAILTNKDNFTNFPSKNSGVKSLILKAKLKNFI